jgi:hypothetical protein
MEGCQGCGISVTCETDAGRCRRTLPRSARQGAVAHLKMKCAWMSLKGWTLQDVSAIIRLQDWELKIRLFHNVGGNNVQL